MSPRRIYEPNRRSVPIPETEGAKVAKRIRETFTASPLKFGAYDMGIEWPTGWRYVGKGLSIAYSSDKWEKTAKFNDYKHVAEDHQDVFVADDVFANRGKPVGVDADMAGYTMPNEVAELAKFLFIEYQPVDRVVDDEPILAKDPVRAVASGSTLYAGKASGSGGDKETFLLVASREGCVFLVTGPGLDILADGIVG